MEKEMENDMETGIRCRCFYALESKLLKGDDIVEYKGG